MTSDYIKEQKSLSSAEARGQAYVALERRVAMLESRLKEVRQAQEPQRRWQEEATVTGCTLSTR